MGYESFHLGLQVVHDKIISSHLCGYHSVAAADGEKAPVQASQAPRTFFHTESSCAELTGIGDRFLADVEAGT
eukprot:4490034-Amphidinium_carterae.1